MKSSQVFQLHAIIPLKFGSFSLPEKQIKHLGAGTSTRQDEFLTPDLERVPQPTQS